MPEMREEERVNLPPHCSLCLDRREAEEGDWREALVSGGDHLKRALDEYVELGFECLLLELDPSEVEGCTECFKISGERIYRVYVRPRQPR